MTWNSTFKTSKPMQRKTPMRTTKPMKRAAWNRSSKRIHKIDDHHDNKMLVACREEPCYLRIPGVCIGGTNTTVPAHSNQFKHGKAMGMKANDRYTVPACFACHAEIDQGNRFTRDEKFALWDDAYSRWAPERDKKLCAKPAAITAGNKNPRWRAGFIGKSDMTILALDPLDINISPRISVAEITPEVASKWISRNIGNRPTSQATVTRYAREMGLGLWKMAGDPIRFSKTGKLIDGQHRLHAIIQSGVTVTCVVMRDLDDEVFDVLDSGRGRGKSDVLFIELGLPVETCKILSSAASLMIDYENKQYAFASRSDKRDVMSFVHANPHAVAAAEYAQTLPRRSPPVPRSIAAFFWFYASQRNMNDAVRFLERFMIGAVDGPNDCLLFLRNRCYSAAVDRRPMHRTHVISALIRVWNAEQRGRPIKHPQNALRQDDTFPTFI